MMTPYLRTASVAVIIFLSLHIISCSKPSDPNPEPEPQPEVPDPRSWYASTVAGVGMQGNLNGPAQSAAFGIMEVITADAAGNIYVGDNQSIRKISNGQVTTFAGKGSGGNQAFGLIDGIVVNKQGIIYDVEGPMIRKINSDASDVYFAGTGTYEYKDGIGTNAGFRQIYHIALDKDENLILPDYDLNQNQILRKITPSGVVTTLPLIDNTGFSSGSTASLIYITCIAIDPSGNIYYSSAKNQMIKKRDLNGNVTAFAGTDAFGTEDGQGTAARFMGITGMTCDASGNIYVAMYSTHSIRKITPSGKVTTIIGVNGPGAIDGHTDSARLKRPMGLAVDKNGAVLIVDQGNFKIRKLELK
ncbi:SMP-30/gluconolactonase/LRE family protein [Pollutibacter soli]|uniref:SMP-30/gluconolactonase/LRE family protein n=1 Tax=Pollutibacter soli TaxID=3034157 RepID=UPI003013409F